MMINLRSDPKLRDFFDYIARCDKDWEGLSLDEIRKRDTAYIKEKVQPVMAVEHVEDYRIPDSGMLLRMYTPRSSQKTLPVGVYLHGGGWVLGSVEQADHVARILANGLRNRKIKLPCCFFPGKKQQGSLIFPARARKFTSKKHQIYDFCQILMGIF